MAAEQDGLWLEALDLLSQVSEERRRELVATTLELDQAALEAIVATVVEHELWPEALVIAEHDTTLQDTLAERLPALPARQRQAIARRAKQLGVISRLGSLGVALAKR